MPFLPVDKKELPDPDFVLISGDAYVDHISFGHALIARLIKSQGFSVGIIPQPVKDSDYMTFPMPKYAYLVASGVVDSMVNNYTAAKRKRSDDQYSDKGLAGRRPDRALIVYCKTLRRLFPDSFIIAGGIEASLRRFSHYDYFSDTVMHSALIDSSADLFIYGMGELPILNITERLKKGIPLDRIKDIRNTAYIANESDILPIIQGRQDGYRLLSSHEKVSSDKRAYAKTFSIVEQCSGYSSPALVQKQDYIRYVVQNPPERAMTEQEMDFVAALPFMRAPHPMYENVPSIEEVRFSINSHRGCFGACSFCALTYHQGRSISRRSKDSIVNEAEELTGLPGFKGYIHDIGGPSANFYSQACAKGEPCRDKSCAGYSPCTNMRPDHTEYLDILRAVRSIKKVKKVFVRSGIRFDYLLMDKKSPFFEELVKYHISGQLKVAPEHVSDRVLKVMNKPRHAVYEEFRAKFFETTKKAGLEQYIVPYFISSHPGCTLEDAIELAQYLKSIGYTPEQVQDFYPTPSTRATTMYYTGLDPDTLEPVYTAKTAQDKQMQRALLQYNLPKNRETVISALMKAGRSDLIGSGRHCLIDGANAKPYKGGHKSGNEKQHISKKSGKK